MYYKNTIIIILSFVLLMFFDGCISIEKYNVEIDKKQKVSDLISDVDYIQKRLEKLHPDLYRYISKSELNYKFDSLRSSIRYPITSNDFYFKLSPVISAIKQGHIQMSPLTKKLDPSKRKQIYLKGTSPLVKFDLELFDNKLYVVNVYSKDTTIKVGTEILSINGVKPEVIIDKYINTFSSDGYNSTFVPRKLAKSFSRFFYYHNDITDSVNLELKYRGVISHVMFSNQDRLNRYINESDIKKVRNDENKRIADVQKKINGYNNLKHTYSKQLIFPVKDSSVAILKISDFMNGDYKKFYKKSFSLLNSSHTKTLIIDLRDNFGGRLLDVNTLYSYLSDSSFQFIRRSETVSKTSLWHTNFLKDKPLMTRMFTPLLLPSIGMVNIYMYLMTTKDKNNKYHFGLSESFKMQPQSNRFKGKVYVLINGGSFSASCLLASNLQGSNRATFVGQETGGANNGCVAGYMTHLKLPNSKLKIKFGLLVCQSPYESEIDGHGIYPDIEVYPTLLDRINGVDPELKYVFNDINASM